MVKIFKVKIILKVKIVSYLREKDQTINILSEKENIVVKVS